MEELEWKADRPYQYYFRFNLKRMRHDKNKMQRMYERDREKMK